MSSAQVSENVKQARENALVGCYDEAKVYYSGAIQGVQQVLKQTPEPDKKQKWKQVGCEALELGVFHFSSFLPPRAGSEHAQ